MMPSTNKKKSEVLLDKNMMTTLVTRFSKIFTTLQDNFSSSFHDKDRADVTYNASRLYREVLKDLREECSSLELQESKPEYGEAAMMIEVILKFWHWMEILYLSSGDAGYLLTEWLSERPHPDAETNSARAFTQLILRGDFVGLVTRIKASVEFPQEIRETFCTAIAHFPLNTRTRAPLNISDEYLISKFRMFHKLIDKSHVALKSYPVLHDTVMFLRGETGTMRRLCKDWVEFFIAQMTLLPDAPRTKDGLREFIIDCEQLYGKRLQVKTLEWLLYVCSKHDGRHILQKAEELFFPGELVGENWFMAHMVDLLSKCEGLIGEARSLNEDESAMDIDKESTSSNELRSSAIKKYIDFLCKSDFLDVIVHYVPFLPREDARVSMSKVLKTLDFESCDNEDLNLLTELSDQMGLSDEIGRLCVRRASHFFELALEPNEMSIEHIVSSLHWFQRSGLVHEELRFQREILNLFWEDNNRWANALGIIGEERRHQNGLEFVKLNLLQDFIGKVLDLFALQQELDKLKAQHDNISRSGIDTVPGQTLLQKLGLGIPPSPMAEHSNKLQDKMLKVVTRYFEVLHGCFKDMVDERFILPLLNFALPLLSCVDTNEGGKPPSDEVVAKLVIENLPYKLLMLMKGELCKVPTSIEGIDKDLVSSPEYEEAHRVLAKLHLKCAVISNIGGSTSASFTESGSEFRQFYESGSEFKLF